MSTCLQRAQRVGYLESVDNLLRVIDIEKVRIEDGLNNSRKNWDCMEKALEEKPVNPVGNI